MSLTCALPPTAVRFHTSPSVPLDLAGSSSLPSHTTSPLRVSYTYRRPNCVNSCGLSMRGRLSDTTQEENPPGADVPNDKPRISLVMCTSATPLLSLPHTRTDSG